MHPIARVSIAIGSKSNARLGVRQIENGGDRSSATAIASCAITGFQQLLSALRLVRLVTRTAKPLDDCSLLSGIAALALNFIANPVHATVDALSDHFTLELREDAKHLKHCAAA